MSGIQQRVGADIAFLRQHLTDVLGDVLSAVVEDVRDVLDQHGERLEGVYVAEILLVKPRTRVVAEGLGMGRDLAQLRAPDPGEGLTGRPADDQVDGVCDRAEIQVSPQCLGERRDDVPRPAVFCIAAVEVARVRARGVRIGFDGRPDSKAGGLEAQRKPAAAGEQVEDARRTPGTQPGDLP